MTQKRKRSGFSVIFSGLGGRYYPDNQGIGISFRYAERLNLIQLQRWYWFVNSVFITIIPTIQVDLGKKRLKNKKKWLRYRMRKEWLNSPLSALAHLSPAISINIRWVADVKIDTEDEYWIEFFDFTGQHFGLKILNSQNDLYLDLVAHVTFTESHVTVLRHFLEVVL